MVRQRAFSAVMAAVLSVLLLGFGTARPAEANEKTWRMLTYGAGAVTAYGIVKKNPTLGILGAAGTYLAYRKWKGDVRDRHSRQGRVRTSRHSRRR